MATRGASGRARDTAARILDVAERLVQTAASTASATPTSPPSSSITKASLHYHFASKAELGEALIARYAARFAAALADDRRARPPTPRAKLDAYAGLYADVLRDQRMCLCGMLAAEYQTLPEPMRDAVIALLRRQRGLARGVLTRDGRTGRCGSPVPGRDGADDRQRARGRHARRAPLRRHLALRSGRRPPPGEPRRTRPRRVGKISSN